jgi:hypothetical protein
MTRGRGRETDPSHRCYPNLDWGYRGWVGWGDVRAHGHAAEVKYLDRHSCVVFPGSAGVSPAQKAAILAALPEYKLSEHHGSNMMSGYLLDAANQQQVFSQLVSSVKRARLWHG